MMLEITGIVLVIAASTALGLYFSGIDTFRIQDLMAFKQAFLILESEIEFVAAPLPEAMQNITARSAKPVSDIFADFAQGLSAGGGETAYQLWTAAIQKHKRKSYCNTEDWEILSAFGKTLGYLDKPMQLNTIRYTIGYIESKVAFLETGCAKNKRMYRSLGLVGGVLLAIIFI